MHFGIKHTI